MNSQRPRDATAGENGGVSRETPPASIQRVASWRSQEKLLHQLRVEEGRSIPDIAAQLGRTEKSVQRKLERKRWILYPRYQAPDAKAEIAETVARLEAEDA
jgi:IS30 family transposase